MELLQLKIAIYPTFAFGGQGMSVRSTALVVAVALGVSACASRPDDISAAYVSPLPYQQLSCEQLAAEAQRVSISAAAAAGAQNQQASNDAVATAIGVVVFWPALFLIKGDNAKAGEVARLKGEMQAIEQASIAKQCDIRFQGAPAASPKPPQTASAQAKAAPAAPAPKAAPAAPAAPTVTTTAPAAQTVGAAPN